MTLGAALLKIEPRELQFPFELKKQISCWLHLENVTDEHVAFKVLTNKPDTYTIRFNSGIFPPRAKCDIFVSMQASSEAPPGMKCEDEFLLKSFTTSANIKVKDITNDLFTEKSGNKFHVINLPVVFVDSPNTATKLLEIEPGTLQFPFEPNKQISCPFQLKNRSDDNVAFQMMLTNPKNYCVQPYMGIMPPGSTCDVVVKMQAQLEASSVKQWKDELLVQSFLAKPGITANDLTIDMFTTGNKDRIKLAATIVPEATQATSEDDESTHGSHLLKVSALRNIIKDDRNVVGSGGFSKVYSGILKVDQKVAVKVLNVAESAKVDKSVEQNFKNEVNILSGTKHRNVVKLLGYYMEGNQYMLVSEFVPNGNLFDILHGDNKGKLSFDMRLDIAIDSADGFAYIHSPVDKYVLHGDIKSANILLDEYMRPKIVDFGLSRLLDTVDTIQTFTVKGTPGYIDPQYYVNGNLKQQSDVYSFGVVLLELLTRRKATEGKGSGLAHRFTSAYRDHRAIEMFDKEIATEEDMESLEEFAEVAFDCVHEDADMRPAMRMVWCRLLELRCRRLRKLES